MPRVGIILSTYNRPDMLRRMVESIQAQDWHDWVLYLCDDASDDPQQEAALQEIAADNRVRLLRNPHNWGNVTRGRNTAIMQGLNEDGCDYFCFSDDDNTWKPQRLSAALNFMTEHPECGLSWCRCEGMRDGRSVGRLRQDEPTVYDRKYLLGRPYIDSNELMVRAEVFEHIGLFDERLQTLEDWDFTLRAGLQYQFLHCPDELINYGLHDDNRVQKTMHLNGQSCRLMAEREQLAGPRYRVLFVCPTGDAQTICHSHKQVMDYLDLALTRLPFVHHKVCLASEPVERLANEFKPNLIIYFYPARVPDSATNWLGRYPYPSLGLCVEDPYAHEMNKRVRPIYEWFVTNERSCLEAYKTEQKPYALVMPSLSADRIEHAPIPDLSKEIDLLLVGAPYPPRIAALASLVELIGEGRKIVAAGEGWTGKAPEGMAVIDRNVSGREYVELIGKSHIVLIVNRAGCEKGQPMTPARGFIEAYAGGCLLMQEDRADLGRYFSEDKEYVGWKHFHELPEKARELLQMADKRTGLAQAANKRAQRYTYEQRLTRLFMLTRGYRKDDEVR